MAFVIRRLIGALLVMFALSVLVFLIFYATPGVDPASRIAGRNADPETLKQVRHDFGLDRPLPVQYAILMKKLFITRDLASFVNRGVKVVPQIAAAAPVTLSLVFGATILWVVFSIAMGLAAAVMRGTFVDPLLMVIGLDRHLDACLLAGRGGQPDHAEPAPRRAVLMAAAARVHAVRRSTRGSGSCI